MQKQWVNTIVPILQNISNLIFSAKQSAKGLYAFTPTFWDNGHLWC